MKQYIKTEETDWMRDYGVYAVNRNTRLFENTSAVKGYVIKIYYGLDEGEISSVLADFLRTGSDYDFALYTSKHELCGFVYSPESVNQSEWELPSLENAQIENTQGDISYGEVAELGNQFDKQLLEKGITLCDDEYYTEALLDFIDQYQNGNDKPEVNLHYPHRQIGYGSIVKFKDLPHFEGVIFQVSAVYRPGEITGGGEINKTDEIIYQLTPTNNNFKPVLIGRGSELEPLKK